LLALSKKAREIADTIFIASLHDQKKSGFLEGRVYMIKRKVAFWRAGFFPANQSFLNTFSITLIGWIKAGHSKKPHLF